MEEFIEERGQRSRNTCRCFPWKKETMEKDEELGEVGEKERQEKTVEKKRYFTKERFYFYLCSGYRVNQRGWAIMPIERTRFYYVCFQRVCLQLFTSSDNLSAGNAVSAENTTRVYFRNVPADGPDSLR